MRDDEYFAIKERAARYLLNIPQVTAVGLGGRETKGRSTGEIAIKVFVSRKRPLDELPLDERVPPSFEGVPTDVAEMGPIGRADDPTGVTHAGGMLPDIDTYTPLRGGISLSTEGKEGVATLGCFLQDKVDASAIYALTNHHVVTPDGKLSRSRRVAHPSALDNLKFVFDPAHSIGIVAEARDEPILDAAVVRLKPLLEWLPFVEDVGFLTGTHDLTLAEVRNNDYHVRKRGAKTKFTAGFIACIEADCLEITTTVEGKVRKKNIFIRPIPAPADPSDPNAQSFFSYGGDSGSVVVNDDNQVVALLYATDEGINPETGGYGIAVPIGTVFRRLRELGDLDLEVATPVTNEPDETIEIRSVPHPAGVPTVPGPEQIAQADHDRYRPLTGGVQIMAAPMLGDANSATLGCIVTDTSDPSIAYILTSYGAVSAEGSIPPTDDTRVGQPNNLGSCSGCCSNTVGKYAKGGPAHQTPTAALVRLEDDQRWLAEIMQVGLIADTAVAISGENVVKYGAASGLTGGRVVEIDPRPSGVLADALIIRPHSNPDRPDEEVRFSRFGDRGAAIVNQDRQVVGVLYDDLPLDDPDGRKVIHGIAMPIQSVLDTLKDHAGVQVEVATSAEIDFVHGAAARTALNKPTRAAGWAVDLPEELLWSPAGKMLTAAWREHQREITDLIDHNRKVAAAWHRSGGPEMLQALIRAFHSPTSTLPAMVNGRPVAACLDRLTQVFCKYGSAALRGDLSFIRRLLPPLGGLSFVQLVDALNGAVGSHTR